MSKELVKVQVSSPRESENSIGVFVKLFFDKNGNYSSGSDLQWFPKSQCTIQKIEPEDSTKQFPSYFLTAPKWLIEKKIKKN